MTVAQITPPAPRTDALAGHAYCLPVVRELPVLDRRPRRRPHLVTTSRRQGAGGHAPASAPRLVRFGDGAVASGSAAQRADLMKDLRPRRSRRRRKRR